MAGADYRILSYNMINYLNKHYASSSDSVRSCCTFLRAIKETNEKHVPNCVMVFTYRAVTPASLLRLFCLQRAFRVLDLLLLDVCVH
jgi:hypothetical protein